MPRQSALIAAAIDWIACRRIKDFKENHPDTTDITTDMVRCSGSFDGCWELLTTHEVVPCSCCEDILAKVCKKLIIKLGKSRKNAYAMYRESDECWIDEDRMKHDKYHYDATVCAFLMSNKITKKHLRDAVEKHLKNNVTEVKMDIFDYI